ncbi:MAG: hypothetical protein K6G75_13065 [Lachnospiraceae bacterium]|nr:hypothetical protein [Lachnospiraceae bacterium]
MARVVNLIIFIAELVSLIISLNKKEKAYIYYTQISNSICMVSSLLLVIFGMKLPVELVRYTATSMLALTMLVTVFVLLPMLKTVKLFTGRNLVLHIFCPVLSIFSYVFLEKHVKTYFIVLPLIITFIYGLIMIILNAKEKVKGPYPFFEVNKIGKKATAIWIAVMLSITAVVSGITGFHPGKKTDIKFIFVHGLSGYGSYDAQYEFIPYWGMTTGDVMLYLNNIGYESYAASVDPTGSAWDRACELYAQLYGTRVDYGEEHSKRCNHERYGEDYTGRALLKDFEGSRFVLIGHSFGGATIRLFSEILVNGSKDERAYTEDGSLSEFFMGGNGDGLVALVTLAAPTNGTTAYDLYEDPAFDQSAIDIPEKYLKNGDTVSKNIKNKNDGRTDSDHAGFDMHIDNALLLNGTITTFDNVYYFAVPYVSTKEKEGGGYYPDPKITESIFMKGAINMANYTGYTKGGFKLDESWQPNDGLVNTISAGAPFGEETLPYTEDAKLKPGVWYVFPTVTGDHMAPQGGLTKRVSVKPFYRNLCKMLSAL